MNLSRRNFVKTTTAAGAVAVGFSLLDAGAKGLGKDIKLALVGCGGRGNGALKQCLQAAKMNQVEGKVVATCDWFKNKAVEAGSSYGVPENMCFDGADGYKKVMETDADLVLMATPPNFRPIHFEAAIRAGKHCFVEKPIAVDPPGVRRFLAAGEQATTKRLAVVAGTQRRYESGYRKNKHLIEKGAIGKILNGQVYWCARVPWIRERTQGQSDQDYLLNNWLNWCMMSGDHIVEQHVHQLDVTNWFLGRPPVTAHAFGGRARRTTGDTYDFFSVDYDYGDDCHVHSMCRQIEGCYTRVGESYTGTKGRVSGGGKISPADLSVDLSTPEFMEGSGQVLEHYELIKSIKDAKPLNAAQDVAYATMTAIMGRMSAYTGQVVRWTDVMSNSDSKFYNLTLNPTAEDFETGNVKAPRDDVIPIPGQGQTSILLKRN